MVKEQVGQDEFGGRRGTDPFLQIGGNDGGEPVLPAKEFKGGIGDAGLAIDKKETGSMPTVWESLWQQGGEEVSVATTEIDQAGGGAIGVSFLKPAEPEMGLAEERVEPLKVTTAGQRGRVGGGKGVENFGGKVTRAHERTSRRAP